MRKILFILLMVMFSTTFLSSSLLAIEQPLTNDYYVLDNTLGDPVYRYEDEKYIYEFYPPDSPSLNGQLKKVITPKSFDSLAPFQTQKYVGRVIEEPRASGLYQVSSKKDYYKNLASQTLSFVAGHIKYISTIAEAMGIVSILNASPSEKVEFIASVTYDQTLKYGEAKPVQARYFARTVLTLKRQAYPTVTSRYVNENGQARTQTISYYPENGYSSIETITTRNFIAPYDWFVRTAIQNFKNNTVLNETLGLVK